MYVSQMFFDLVGLAGGYLASWRPPMNEWVGGWVDESSLSDQMQHISA